MSALERAGLADLADAYRKLADLAVEAAADTALGVAVDRDAINDAVERIAELRHRLWQARRGYDRLTAARFGSPTTTRRVA